MLRLFIGIALPQPLRQQLQLLQGGIPGARWTHMDDYHITLSFIGEVDEATAEDIDDILSHIRAPRFDLTLNGTGSFSRGDSPGYLWAGVEKNEALHFLKEKIDAAFRTKKIAFEEQKFTPHVTLARLKNSPKEEIAGFMQRHNLFSSEPFAVDEFVLYRSHMANTAPFYEAVAGYPLTG